MNGKSENFLRHAIKNQISHYYVNGISKGDLRMGYFLQIEHTEQEQPKTKAWILSVAMH